MDKAQVHEIERECARVLMQCRRYGDQREFEKAASLFTPDVIFNGGDGEPLVGREANIAAMHANIGDVFMRCFITNILVTVEDADHASATSYWLMYRYKLADIEGGKLSDSGPAIICESDDKFVRTEEGWLIAQRDFKPVL